MFKNVTYNAKKLGRKSHIAAVKGEMKNLYYQDRYRMTGRKIKFEKRYSFLTSVFEK